MGSILLVEDDDDLRAVVVDALGADGHDVRAVVTGEEALDELSAAAPDLVLLDVALGPGLDGVEVCRRVRRADTDLPIMVVTARGREADVVYALEAGADDYLVKPVGLVELRSRVRAALRRAARGSAATGGAGSVTAGPLRVDRGARVAFAGEVELALTPSELSVLEALVAAAPAVRSRAELVQAIFGDAVLRDPRAIDVHVHHVREKLAAAGVDPGLLVTVRGAGYRVGG